MSRLGLKIFIILLIVSVGGLFLASLFIDRAINYNFRNYLRQNREARDEELVAMVEELYKKNENWRELLPELTKLEMYSRVLIRIEDDTGNIIYNGLAIRRRGMMGQHMGPPGMFGRMIPFQPEERTYNLEVEEKQIGRIYIISGGQNELLNARDKYFVKKVKRAILMAAGIISILTLLLSLLFSHNLTSPLLQAIEATKKIARGDYSYRVKIKRNDELAQLGEAFNRMARKLEHLDKIRREGTSDLAHELRTPLANIRSYLEAMEDGVMDISRDNLKEVYTELMRLVKLVDRIGELNNAEGKVFNLREEKIDINKILINVVMRFKKPATNQGIELKVNTPPGEVYIYGEEESIVQIFDNLLNNALKYTEPGDLIKVILYCKEKEVKINIHDTGIGIPEEDLPYIFERFYRSDKSRSRQSGGTGIGLAIVKKLIEAHKGKINVKSTPGKGTNFTISLPLAQK